MLYTTQNPFLDSKIQRIVRLVKHFLGGFDKMVNKQGSNITRVMYFFYEGKKIVATNGFVKKTRKIPAKELEIAKERRADWLSRHKE